MLTANIPEYLPTLHNILGAGGLGVVAVLLVQLGTVGREGFRRPPEIRLLMGWGLSCLALTVWGISTATDLRLGLLLLAAVALFHLWRGRVWRGGSRDVPGGVGGMLLLTLPLWLILLPVRPSQVDTWLNLLPNAAYLYDHGMFPADSRPESHSFLPGAPYNTQFVAFAASVVSGSFAESALSLFHIFLQGAAALFIARAVAGGMEGEERGRPGWGPLAAGILIALPLNPGFVPRLFFSSYGEGPLAVATMAAVWYAATLLDELARGCPRPKSAPVLALILAAMVNIKQQGIGEAIAVAMTLCLLALAHPLVPKRRAFLILGLTLLPAMGLYGLWRFHVLTNFAAGELKPLPFSAWNWSLLPQIFGGIFHAMTEKATFFLLEAALLVIASRRFRRPDWTPGTILLGMTAGTILLFTAFIVITYIAHFPPAWAVRAHSFFRYSAQMSLAMMLALTVALRPFAARLADGGIIERRVVAGAAGLALLLPVLFLGRMRFDLDRKERQFWRIGTEAAAALPPGGSMLLRLPEDATDSIAGDMLQAVIRFIPPRRPELEFGLDTRPQGAGGGLDRALEAGYRLVLISCTPAGLPENIPAGIAALLEREDGRWQIRRQWACPPAPPAPPRVRG